MTWFRPHHLVFFKPSLSKRGNKKLTRSPKNITAFHKNLKNNDYFQIWPKQYNHAQKVTLKTVASLLGPSVKLAADVICKFEILRCKEIKTRLCSKKKLKGSAQY